MTMPPIDQAVLKHLIRYDPETGVFVWLPRANAKAWNTRYAGKEAGYVWKATGGRQYRSIRIFDWPFLAHRLACLYVTGEWPAVDVDHEDGDGLNNRWTNLRPATKSQNGANRPANRNNKTGFKGVSMHAGRFRAAIKGRVLGYRDTAEEAAALYAEAAATEFGEFARSK